MPTLQHRNRLTAIGEETPTNGGDSNRRKDGVPKRSKTIGAKLQVGVAVPQIRSQEFMRYDMHRKTPAFPTVKLEKGEQPIEADKLAPHLQNKRRKHFLPTMAIPKYTKHKAELRARGPSAEKPAPTQGKLKAG